MNLITRFFERLLGRGWGKDVAAGAIDPPNLPGDQITVATIRVSADGRIEVLPNLLSPCALSPSKPHFYGRLEARGTKCLRCGFERTGK